MAVITLMKDIRTVAVGDATPALPRYEGDTNLRSFQAVVEGSGAVSATVAIEASNNGRHWLPCLTFSLSGTDSATDGDVVNSPWAFFRATVTAISGSNASVEVVEAT
jgi:hypothetical protein